jgi:hypothetical protein
VEKKKKKRSASLKEGESQVERSGRIATPGVTNSRGIDEEKSEKKRSAKKGRMATGAIANGEGRCRSSGSKEVERV